MSNIEHVRFWLLWLCSGCTKLNRPILFGEILFVDFDKIRIAVIWFVDFVIRECQIYLKEWGKKLGPKEREREKRVKKGGPNVRLVLCFQALSRKSGIFATFFRFKSPFYSHSNISCLKGIWIWRAKLAQILRKHPETNLPAWCHSYVPDAFQGNVMLLRVIN